MTPKVETSTAETSTVESAPSQGRHHFAAVLLASIVVVVMLLANLPLRYVESEGKWRGAAEIDEGGVLQKLNSMPTMAGWPLRYWVRYDDGSNAQDRLWSPARLGGNLAMTCIAALLVYTYMVFRSRHVGRGRRTALILDLGLAATIVLVPASLVAWEYRVAQQHRTLSRHLLRYGNCQLSCWLPEPLVQHMPRSLLGAFMRLRRVHLFGVDHDTMMLVAKTPTLVEVHCFGGDFESSSIEPLIDNVHLHAFQLSRRDLSQSAIEAIARLPFVYELNLSQTNLDAKGLRCFDEMKLKAIDLTRTSLLLSEVGKPGWSATAESVSLSRPPLGVEGSIEVKGWPELRILSVSRPSREMNDATLTVRLADLPNLEVLRLDRTQKHDLSIKNLPRLSNIDEGLGWLQRLFGGDELMPGHMWVSRLEVNGASSLTSLGCFARDLQELSIAQVPSLRSVAIGSYFVTIFGDIHTVPAAPEQCQQWIRQLGGSQGPSTMDLTALPLAAADLSPLAVNSRIRHLKLGLCGVSFEQVQNLRGMDQLETLDLRTCELQEDQLSWLLEKFPNLKEVVVDGAKLKRIELTSRNKLRSLSISPIANADVVRIVDVPLVKTQIHLMTAPRVLEIRNAQSLKGLAVDGPWPEDAVLQGVRDLDWFAAGGKYVDDELLDELLDCRSLDQLTLAYTSVTRTSLQEVGELSELSMLALPGSDLDDDVTRHWSPLKSLWEVNLDDTAVSVSTIAWLGRIESLRRVSLNRVAFNEAAADAIAELDQVSDLQLAGVSLDPAKLLPLVESGNLESLNLSGWNVDSELAKVLKDVSSLKFLRIRDCETDPRSLQQILSSNPTLCVDVGPAIDSLDKQIANEIRKRGGDLASGSFRRWRSTIRDFTGETGSFEDVEAAIFAARSGLWFLQAGQIDPQRFRPPSPES